MSLNSRVVIVGAGLVGCLWAVMLRKKGLKVTLLERRQDLRKAASNEERSINLVITSRGLKGLETAGLLKEAIQLSVPIFGRMIHAQTGEAQFQPYGNADECNFSISRSELNKFLLSAAEKEGVEIQFERNIQNVDFEAKKISLGSGSETLAYDILFATDGAGSRIRNLLTERYPESFQETTEWLEADYKELFMPAKAKGKYQLEERALHIWPRGSHMMMALANLDGSFTMTMYLPKDNAEVSFAKIQSDSEIKNLFETEFPDAQKLMPEYLRDYKKNPQGKLGTVRCSKWVLDSSVVLMGDAAHAIVPFFGQGMNCGFEDCTKLLGLLNEKGSWAEALPIYESEQKANSQAIADMAIENWTEMRDKVGDPQFQLRKQVETFLEGKFPNIYKSRYGMVTYTLIPYAVAKEAGKVQANVLDLLCTGLAKAENIDLYKAARVLERHMQPFNRSKRIETKTDPLVVSTRKMF